MYICIIRNTNLVIFTIAKSEEKCFCVQDELVYTLWYKYFALYIYKMHAFKLLSCFFVAKHLHDETILSSNCCRNKRNKRSNYSLCAQNFTYYLQSIIIHINENYILYILYIYIY